MSENETLGTAMDRDTLNDLAKDFRQAIIAADKETASLVRDYVSEIENFQLSIDLTYARAASDGIDQKLLRGLINQRRREREARTRAAYSAALSETTSP